MFRSKARGLNELHVCLYQQLCNPKVKFYNLMLYCLEATIHGVKRWVRRIYPIVFSAHNWIYFVNTNGKIIMHVLLQCSPHKIQALGWSFLACKCDIKGQIGTCILQKNYYPLQLFSLIVFFLFVLMV